MLVIAGHLEVDPDQTEPLMAAAVDMMVATRSEAGCQEYVFSLDPSTPGKVMIFEVWDSDEALASHFAAPHMAEFQSKLSSLDIRGRDISKYEIASVGPLR